MAPGTTGKIARTHTPPRTYMCHTSRISRRPAKKHSGCMTGSISNSRAKNPSRQTNSSRSAPSRIVFRAEFSLSKGPGRCCLSQPGQDGDGRQRPETPQRQPQRLALQKRTHRGGTPLPPRLSGRARQRPRLIQARKPRHGQQSCRPPGATTVRGAAHPCSRSGAHQRCPRCGLIPQRVAQCAQHTSRARKRPRPPAGHRAGPFATKSPIPTASRSGCALPAKAHAARREVMAGVGFARPISQ